MLHMFIYVFRGCKLSFIRNELSCLVQTSFGDLEDADIFYLFVQSEQKVV